MSVIQAQTSGKELRYVRCDDEGRLTTNLEATIDDVLMKGETAGGVKTPVLVQTDGKLESMCFGKTGAGADKELLVEANGAFVLGGGSVKTAISSVDGSTQSIQVDSTGALIVRTDNSNDSIRITGLNSAGANKGIGVEDTDGGILSAGKVVVATPTHADGTRQLLRLNASGELMVNDSSGGGGGGSANTNLYPTLASITTATSFAGGAISSNYIDLTNAKNVCVNCIHTGNATARTNFGSDIALSMEFTDDNTNTVCYSGASSPQFAFGTIDAAGNPTGDAVAVLSLGDRSDASGAITGKFARVVAVNNDSSGTATAFAVTFKVVIDGI
jgi:hypothetical protein